MGKLIKSDNAASILGKIITGACKTETFAGKTTARVTKKFLQSDGSILKVTKKINKDMTVSDILEHRHK